MAPCSSHCANVCMYLALLQRIDMEGIFGHPWCHPMRTAVSLCLALLQRIDMEGIFGHPWFQRDLPEGALAMNGSYMQSAPNLDQVRGCVGVWGGWHVADGLARPCTCSAERCRTQIQARP